MKFKILIFAMLSTIHCFSQEQEGAEIDQSKEFQLVEKELRKQYSNGQLEELIINFNNKCLSKTGGETLRFRFTDSDTKAEIYSLISAALIATDRPEEASVYLKSWYVIKHSKDFSDEWLYIRKDREKYYILPNILLGLNLGTIYSSPIVKNRQSVFENIDSNSKDPINYQNRNSRYDKKYNSLFEKSSFSIGLSLDYRILRDLIISFNPTYLTKEFASTSTLNWNKGDFIQDVSIESAQFIIDHVYSLTYFEIPLDLKYVYSKMKFKPFFGVGIGYSKLIDAEILEVETKNIINSSGVRFNYVSNENFQAKEYFKSIFSVRAFAGCSYSWKNGLDFSVKVLYQKSIAPIVDIKNAFSIAGLVWGSYYAMDEFEMQSLRLELSLLFPITFKAFTKK